MMSSRRAAPHQGSGCLTPPTPEAEYMAATVPPINLVPQPALAPGLGPYMTEQEIEQDRNCHCDLQSSIVSRSNGNSKRRWTAASLTMLLLLNSETQPDIASFHARSAADSSTESFCGASLRFCSLFLAISRRRIRFERAKKTSRDPCYFIDRGHERGFVCLRRFIEAADFSHELQRRGTNLIGSDRRIEIEKDFYIPAHSI